MRVNGQTFTRVDIDTLTGIHINHLEGSQTFNLHHFIVVDTLLDCLNDSGHKQLRFAFGHSCQFCQTSSQVTHEYSFHYSPPPFFIWSFQETFGLNVKANLGGTSIR